MKDQLPARIYRRINTIEDAQGNLERQKEELHAYVEQVDFFNAGKKNLSGLGKVPFIC